MVSMDDDESVRGTPTRISPTPGEFETMTGMMATSSVLNLMPESHTSMTSRTLENIPHVSQDSITYGMGASHRSSFPSDANTPPRIPRDSKDSCSAVSPSLPNTIIRTSGSFGAGDLSAKAIPSSPSLDSSLSTKSDIEVGICTLETFTLFPKLPAELRLRVWKEACPESRWIEIHFYPHAERLEACCTSEGSPLFFICHESRTEILKTHLGLQGIIDYRRTVMFDAAKDTLVFLWIAFTHDTKLTEWTSRLHPTVLRSIKSIVWDSDYTCLDYLSIKAVSLRHFLPCDEDRLGLGKMSGLERVHFANFCGNDGRLLHSVEIDECEDIRQLTTRVGREIRV